MGGSSTTVTPSTPPPSENELALQGKQLELAQSQLDAIREQSAYQKDVFAAAKPMLEAQSRLTQQSLDLLGDPNSPEAKARIQRQQEISDIIDKQTLESLQKGGAPTEQQQKLIDTAAQAAIDSGTIDINRTRDENIRILTQELAPQMGLRPSDSPVQTRAAQILAEATRQQGSLTTGVRLAASNAALGAAGQAQAVYGAVGSSRQALDAAQSNFMSDLRDAAAANRLQLAGAYGGFNTTAGQLGLNLATGIPFNVNSAVASMQQTRLAQSSSTTNRGFDSSSLIGPGIGAAASIGAAMI